MKVVLCHNYYKLPGGEDQVFRDEAWLLEQHGHTVIRFEMHNSEIDQMNRIGVARATISNHSVRKKLEQIVRENSPDIVHFHNTFPLISPAAYQAAKKHGIPVVQTLHNFREICPAATLVRNGAICETCIHKSFAWPAITHRCYRQSATATAAVVARNLVHRLKGTWKKDVDVLIALTNHSRELFARAGMPEHKIMVKPNFVRPDPGQRIHEGDFAVFVGRLSAEKGIDVLLKAWQLHRCDIPLVIIGDGPLGDQVRSAAQHDPNIHWLGQLPFEEVLTKIRESKMLIMPSIWYETFGRTMVEAFASGVPVIASNIGAMKEIVTPGETGLHFQVGSPEDLATQVKTLSSQHELRAQFGNRARAEFLEKYTPEVNYNTLMNIYDQAQS